MLIRRALRSLSVLLALLASLASLPALAQPSYEVQIEGAGRHAAMLREYLDIVRRADDPDLSPAEIERRVRAAERQIREMLATQGYFSPTISARVERSSAVPVVRFLVDLGEPARVVSVDIRFKGAIADSAHADDERMRRMRSEWPLRQGDVFEQAAWAKAKTALLSNLLLRDFPAASIAQSEARVDPKTGQVTLHIDIDSGPRFTFGELEIHGLERYSPKIIERLNPIRPGQPYDQDKLSELQERVQETGYFSSAFATVEIDPTRPTLAPVRVDVSELQRKRLGLGVGFSTDTGMRLQTRWLNRSFLDRD